MYEIIYNGGAYQAVVLKNGENVYQGDADEAHEYVLEALGIDFEQDQAEFDKHWIPRKGR